MDIEKIPSIMRANQWAKGAALMDRWFKGTSAIAPAYGPADTSTITMAWVLSFPRAKAVYDQLITDRIWANSKAQEVIASRLRDRQQLSLRPSNFGNLQLPAHILENEQINYRIVGFNARELDDLSAALGRFSFRIAVAGSVTAAAKSLGYQISITHVGIYIKDSYDFNGDQSLGYWDSSDNSVSAMNMFSGDEVTNGDFQAWRNKNKKGSDFLVYSDVKVLRVLHADSFTIRK